MKILQVISTFPPAYSYGGAAKVAYEISKELVKRKHEVTVYTTDVYDSNSRLKFNDNPIFEDGIRIYHFKNVSNFLAKKNFQIALGMYYYLRKNIRNFDIVHIHEYRSLQAIFTYYFAVKYKVPYVLQAHGATPLIIGKTNLKKIYDLFFGYNILIKASKLISVSNAEVEQYLELKAYPSQISLIPNGIDISSFESLPEPGTFSKKYNLYDKRCILFLGRLHERKGIDFLISSFAELVKDIDDVVLVLAGPDENYKSKAEKQISDSKLEGKVVFTGYMQPIDKLSAYVDANVLVYPSIFEIFGLVPFEAIMCNTPVIVTDNCGCGELVRNAKCGLLVEYGNINDLKEKMRWLIENPIEGRKLVRMGRKYIEKNLTWNTAVDQAEKLYDECVSKNI